MAAKYLVHNKSNYNIELLIPAPVNSGRNSACFVLEMSKAVDILPWAGSLQACRRIAQLTDLAARNLIDISESDE